MLTTITNNTKTDFGYFKIRIQTLCFKLNMMTNGKDPCIHMGIWIKFLAPNFSLIQ